MKPGIYVALLRGINVGGHKIVKMEKLRASFEKLGFEDVKTYVQSGNVVFKAAAKSAVDLVRKIEGMMEREFGFEVTVMVRGAEELNRAIQNNPFSGEKGLDFSRLGVVFLSEEPEEPGVKAAEKIAVKPERLHHEGSEIFIYCPNGFGKSKLTNTTLEKMLGVRATTRNWNTVNKLHEMARE